MWLRLRRLLLAGTCAALLLAASGCGSQRSPGASSGESLSDNVSQPPTATTTPSPSHLAGSMAPSPSQGPLIITETQPSDPKLRSCTTSGTAHVRIVTDHTGGVVVIKGIGLEPTEYPGYADGFPPIIWPFGFSADPGPPAVIRDQVGKKIAREDDVVGLAGGVIDENGYHSCLIDGVMYVGAKELR